mgnify:CR=1 FL=1
MPRKLLLALLLSTLTVACSDSSDNDTAVAPFNAEIRRTEHGIPHVRAEDWKGLGYGLGYAYAQDSYCETMRQVVFGIGRSAELMGEDEGDVASDQLSVFLNGDREAFQREILDQLPPYARDLGEGFARGMNRYLAETGVENLPEGDQGCRNAEWVFPFDEIDYWMFLRKVALWGSSDQGIFRRALTSVAGPSAPGAAAATSAATTADWENAAEALAQATAPLRQRGSNGLALGRDATASGRGILLGNPHQPWFGDGAFYQAQLTIPGVYDAAGAVLRGTPLIAIGFNKDVAWTHTVSYANRLTLYELTLNPDNPLQYLYDGAWVDMEQQVVEVLAKQADGSMETRPYTFYTTRHGPIVNLKNEVSLLDGWPITGTDSLLAMRDANLDTGPRFVRQWAEKAQAANLDEYVQALSLIGNPVFHELAADRYGDAFYGEISAIPLVTQEQLDTCIRGSISPLLTGFTSGVLVSLDGSDPACEWGSDPDAPADTNLYSAGQLPQLRTTDYVGNSNNSYWLSDANNPLEGFPSIMGALGGEGMQQFLRTRIGHLMVQERRSDGELSMDPQAVKDFMYENRVYGAEVVMDDIMDICATEAAAPVLAACSALAGWDMKVDLDSRGAQVFTEFWNRIRDELGNDFQNIVQSDEFWAVDFDPADPLNTPAGIDTTLAANHTRVIAALEESTRRLQEAGVALDAPWRQVQYLERGAENIPIHGGHGTAGIYGAISVGLSEGGYVNPRAGNSYIQVVSWDDSDCPLADVILVPSLSTNPESPWFADQTRLYSNKEWVRWRFCAEDIAANQVGDTLVISE